jgi:hypothetical protein
VECTKDSRGGSIIRDFEKKMSKGGECMCLDNNGSLRTG